jgi:hypothetical protein
MEISIIIAPARPDRKAPVTSFETKSEGRTDIKNEIILGDIRKAINPTANPRRENPVIIAILPMYYTYECSTKSRI